MEFENLPSRISIGFPLGLALLFAFIFFMCSLLCCCLHWDRLQSLLQSYGIIVVNPTHMQPPDFSSLVPQKPVFPYQMAKQKQVESLPVLMPGDEVPKFIAMACPCQPPRDEVISIKIDNFNCSQ